MVVNGTTISPAELARVQGAYRIRIPAGEFWYDRMLGAWGGKGGPTMGFIGPGLELGGKLQAGASGSGTNVFVNGSNTWQSRVTGASGFSDGTTGAVFLPNGGIVSTGN